MVEGDEVRVWLVERTYSDDEQNIIITTYATLDGERYYRQERAITSFGQADEGTPISRIVSEANLGDVEPGRKEQYRMEAQRMADKHDPDDKL
ncbi:MAG: hypothetical protein ABEI52_08960 [Halobacteriaceae archaeon]